MDNDIHEKALDGCKYTVERGKGRVFLFAKTAALVFFGIMMGTIASAVIVFFTRTDVASPSVYLGSLVGNSSLIFSSISVIWVMLLDSRPVRSDLMKIGIVFITLSLVLGGAMGSGEFLIVDNGEERFDIVSVAYVLSGLFSVLFASILAGLIEVGRD